MQRGCRVKYHDNGAGFTVSYTSADAEKFSSTWPCSTVQGRGFFGFGKNGDLIDAGGTALRGDGLDWLAFADDCKDFGERLYDKGGAA